MVRLCLDLEALGVDERLGEGPEERLSYELEKVALAGQGAEPR